MPGVVTSQLVNITLTEAADSASWNDIGGGPGSGQNQDVVIQGTDSRSRRADGVTDRGFTYDTVTPLDISSAGVHVGIWINLLQPSAGTVISALLGGGATPTTSPWSEWDVFTAGVTPYPVTGGWQRVWLDPTLVRSDGLGTLNLASVRQFGVRYTIDNVGGTSDNVLLDRIDYTATGLLVNAGTVPSPATFQDFIDADEDDANNRYGVVVTRSGVIFCLARLTIGDATATVFNGEGEAIVFADSAMVSSTFLGITCDLQNAGTSITFSGVAFRSGGSTNLGDFIVTGAAGSLVADNSTSFDGFRVLELTAACTLDSCLISSSGQVTAGGANLSGSVVSNSTAATALLWDVATDPSGLLDDMIFTSAGTGHGIEFGPNTPASITLNGHSYSGYAAVDGSTGNETIYNNTGGPLTINIVSGDTPSIRNGAGASTTVNNAVTLRFDGIINGSRLYLVTLAGGPSVAGIVVLNQVVSTDPFTTAYNYLGDQPVRYVIGNASGPTKYKRIDVSDTIRNTGLSVNIQQALDQ